jgi:hypothetical protein
VSIPADLAGGDHTLRAEGLGPDGTPMAISVGVAVADAAATEQPVDAAEPGAGTTGGALEQPTVSDDDGSRPGNGSRVDLLWWIVGGFLVGAMTLTIALRRRRTG